MTATGRQHRTMAIALAATLGGGCEGPPTGHDACGGAPAFDTAEILRPDPVGVLFGIDTVVVVSGLDVQFHDLDGAALSPVIALPAGPGASWTSGAALSATEEAFSWGQEDAEGAWSLQLAVVTTDGGASDARTLLDSDVSLGTQALERLPGGYASVWRSNEELFFAVFGDDGGASFPLALGRGNQASLVWTGSEVGMVWRTDAEHVFARLSADGEMLGGITVIGARSDYLGPGLCWDGREYVVAHTLRPGSDPGDVYVTRLDAAGAPLDGPVLVSDGNSTSWAPSVACDAGGAVVVWQANTPGRVPGTDLTTSVILLARVSVDGVVGEAMPVEDVLSVERVADTIAMIPGVALRDGRAVVTWTEYGPDGYQRKLNRSLCPL